MTNIEKLRKLDILVDVRQRMGAISAEDTSMDSAINAMTNNALIAQWSAWHLGSEKWWYMMKSHYDELEAMNIKESGF